MSILCVCIVGIFPSQEREVETGELFWTTMGGPVVGCELLCCFAKAMCVQCAHSSHRATFQKGATSNLVVVG